MASNKQNTISESVTHTGIALHTGNRVRIRLQPASENSGIIFKRLDIDSAPEIPGNIEHVIDTERGTTIGTDEAEVHTVEHLLAALTVMAVDNVVVEMTGTEPPVADGSAKPFVDLLREAGTVQQNAERKTLSVTEPLYYEKDETKIVALPNDCFSISCTVKYDQTPRDCQYISLDINEDNFCNQLCEARTFCLFHEIETLIKANLICGGSLDNAVVIKGDAILSREGLRYEDEFVRHKVLDMVGDLALLGAELKAHLIAIKPGHPANIHIGQEILQQNRNTNKERKTIAA